MSGRDFTTWGGTRIVALAIAAEQHVPIITRKKTRMRSRFDIYDSAQIESPAA